MPNVLGSKNINLPLIFVKLLDFQVTTLCDSGATVNLIAIKLGESKICQKEFRPVQGD